MGYFSWFFGLMGKRKTEGTNPHGRVEPRAARRTPFEVHAADDPASPAARTPSPTRSSCLSALLPLASPSPSARR